MSKKNSTFNLRLFFVRLSMIVGILLAYATISLVPYLIMTELGLQHGSVTGSTIAFFTVGLPCMLVMIGYTVIAAVRGLLIPLWFWLIYGAVPGKYSGETH